MHPEGWPILPQMHPSIWMHPFILAPTTSSRSIVAVEASNYQYEVMHESLLHCLITLCSLLLSSTRLRSHPAPFESPFLSASSQYTRDELAHLSHTRRTGARSRRTRDDADAPFLVLCSRPCPLPLAHRAFRPHPPPRPSPRP